ncbi:unknown [Brachyspira sp. CAG:484]|mgnify:FL=1|nr:unknown [Brachyspira sp. CAG:484]
MDDKIYNILSSIVSTNCEITSLIDILEEYSLDKAAKSQIAADIYNMVSVIKEKHIKSAKKLGTLI